MPLHTARILVLSVSCAAGLTACTNCDNHTAAAATGAATPADATLYSNAHAPATAPIGTFDRTKLLVAYYGSALHAAQMADLTKRHTQAVSVGDTALATQLNAEGERRQEVAHQQLAGKAPLTNIEADFHDAIAQLAQREGVARIVAADAAPTGTRTIDLTMQLTSLMPQAARAAR